MKNRRAIFWLATALLLSIGAHVFLSYNGSTGAKLVHRAFLVDAGTASSATRVTLSRKKGADISLERTDHWRISRPFAANADERTVLKLLDIISSTEIEYAFADSELLKFAKTRADFGLEEEEALKVEVTAANAACTLLFGRSTPTGDGTYAAVEGEDVVYVVPPQVMEAVDLTAEGFRQKALIPSWAGAVTAFDIRHGPGTFMRFVREGEIWKMREPAETTADSAKIKKLLEDITTAEAAEFVWPTGAKGESANASISMLAGYGLDSDSAVTLTLRCADGNDRQISFGKNARDGFVYALVHNAHAIVTVDGTLKDRSLAGDAGFANSRLIAMERQSVTRLSLSDGGVNYLVAKGEDGLWRLDAPVAAPADQEKVNALLDRIAALESEDARSEGVEISVAAGVAPVTVSREAALGDMRPEDLRSREIVNIEPANMKRIVITPRGEQPTSVVYDKDRRAWNVEKSPLSGTVNETKMDEFARLFNPLVARNIASLKASSADLKHYGLDEPRLTVAVDQDREDSVRRNLLVGSDAPGGAYATLGAAEAVFVLGEDALEKFCAGIVDDE